jgi:diphthine-ammonia ligase
MIMRLMHLQQQFGISPSGEGGEIETTVLDAPLFRQRIQIDSATAEARGNSGVYHVGKVRLVPK